MFCLLSPFVSAKLWSWPNFAKKSPKPCFMHEKFRSLEDYDQDKAAQLNPAELWTHFWAPSSFLGPGSQLCCFQLCIYFWRHSVQRSALHWLIRAGELRMSNYWWPYFAISCWISLWITQWNATVRNVNLVGRLQYWPCQTFSETRMIKDWPKTPILLFLAMLRIDSRATWSTTELYLQSSHPHYFIVHIPYSFSRKIWFFSIYFGPKKVESVST